MPLLNYTTTVSVDRTLTEIQRMLARARARSIMVDYDQGTPVAVAFMIDTAFGERAFRLPSSVDAVWTVLKQQWKAGKIRSLRYASRDHAARVAWRIVKDWLEAQLALIQAEMATIEQVMLPYMQDQDGRTLYEAMVERQLALPPAQAGNQRALADRARSGE